MLGPDSHIFFFPHHKGTNFLVNISREKKMILLLCFHVVNRSGQQRDNVLTEIYESQNSAVLLFPPSFYAAPSLHWK